MSRRVRQLNSGDGGLSRPLVANTTNLGVADIALREILEEKIGWEMPGTGRTGPARGQETQETLDPFTIGDFRFTNRPSFSNSPRKS